MDNTQGNKMAKDATLREHFAGLAMQGFIAAGVMGMPLPHEVAELAVAYADALLAELDKVQQ